MQASSILKGILGYVLGAHIYIGPIRTMTPCPGDTEQQRRAKLRRLQAAKPWVGSKNEPFWVILTTTPASLESRGSKEYTGYHTYGSLG